MSGAPGLVKRGILSQEEIDNILTTPKERKKREAVNREYKNACDEFRRIRHPFDTYCSDVEKLRGYIGQLVFFAPDTVNGHKRKLIDIINISEEYGMHFSKETFMDIGSPNFTYFHSLLFGEGEIPSEIGQAVNLKNTAMILKSGFNPRKVSTKNLDNFDFYKDHKDIIYFNPISMLYHCKFIYEIF